MSLVQRKVAEMYKNAEVGDRNTKPIQQVSEVQKVDAFGNYPYIGLEGAGRHEMKQKEKPEEAVDHPSHYNMGSIEVIDFIFDQGMGPDFCVANAIKYLSRYKYKNKPIEDLEKAKWYIEYLINELKK